MEKDNEERIAKHAEGGWKFNSKFVLFVVNARRTSREKGTLGSSSTFMARVRHKVPASSREIRLKAWRKSVNTTAAGLREGASSRERNLWIKLHSRSSEFPLGTRPRGPPFLRWRCVDDTRIPWLEFTGRIRWEFTRSISRNRLGVFRRSLSTAVGRWNCIISGDEARDNGVDSTRNEDGWVLRVLFKKMLSKCILLFNGR